MAPGGVDLLATEQFSPWPDWTWSPPYPAVPRRAEVAGRAWPSGPSIRSETKAVLNLLDRGCIA